MPISLSMARYIKLKVPRRQERLQNGLHPGSNSNSVILLMN